MTNQAPDADVADDRMRRLLEYRLPPELIAQSPIEPRDAARLLIAQRATRLLSDRSFRELPQLLQPGDLLVLNDTRVMNARLTVRRASGGAVELLLLRPGEGGQWRALARPARRLREGEWLTVLDSLRQDTPFTIQFMRREDDEVLLAGGDLAQVARLHGATPLPPYIRAQVEDPERYQTVVARSEGSAAAPTAGLHFTIDLLEALRKQEVRVQFITLHVGLDTFQPIKTKVSEHCMHSEFYAVPAETTQAIRDTKAANGRVIAVGTTVTRTLESIAMQLDRDTRELTGWSELFIRPGFTFRVVDGLITNFHVPHTTLLLLVAAFTGVDLTARAYAHAIAARYRFYSFGDAMLIV